MSEETQRDAEQGQEAGGGLVKKLFSKKGDTEDSRGQNVPSEGVAHIPSTVLTVEYLDESEGMDSALREMQERLRRVEEIAGNMQETQSQLIAAVNQQAKDIGRFVESIGRRIDRLYRHVTGGEATNAGPRTAVGAGEPTEGGEAEAPPGGLAPEVAEDRDHQNAWRIARVLAADLEAYHEDAVKEGVLYGTFYKLLREPIEKARATYEQRATPNIVENYDYFARAIDELIVRKRMELEQEGAV